MNDSSHQLNMWWANSDQPGVGISLDQINNRTLSIESNVELQTESAGSDNIVFINMHLCEPWFIYEVFVVFPEELYDGLSDAANIEALELRVGFSSNPTENALCSDQVRFSGFYTCRLTGTHVSIGSSNS